MGLFSGTLDINYGLHENGYTVINWNMGNLSIVILLKQRENSFPSVQCHWLHQQDSNASYPGVVDKYKTNSIFVCLCVWYIVLALFVLLGFLFVLIFLRKRKREKKK